MKFDRPYCLGIQVGNEPELSPRIALTSVGYSFSSLRADTARVSVASLADTTWRHSGENIYRQSGNVGIGTAIPSNRLELAKPNVGVVFQVNTDDGLTRSYGQFETRNGRGDVVNMLVQEGGNVGIGTTTPSNRLEVAKPNIGIVFQVNTDDGLTRSYGQFEARNGRGDRINMIVQDGGNVGIGTANPSSRFVVHNNTGVAFQVTTDGINRSYGELEVRNGRGDVVNMAVWDNGNVGIGTTNPTSKLHVEGTTTTKVLAITGGGDLAEPFEISESQPIPKGALVIIDEENPGQLKLSQQAYDKRVAGVVSGAGGINPGLTLTQEGVLEGGQNVALSGRVYALATAANGPIKPGDLLTTSEVPGHAMKATDAMRSHGTIIGKAMSSLEQGEGLVLVLVNLQ